MVRVSHLIIALAAAVVVHAASPAAHAQTGAGPTAVAVPSDLSALGLADALRLVSTRNRDVQIARRALDASRADRISAGAAPNPSVTLGAGVVNPQSGLLKAASPKSARLEQLIERGNKRELRIAQADRLESAAGADLDDTLRQQWLAVSSAYFDLLLAQERLALASETAELFGRSVEANELRLRAGDVAAADVSRLRVDALRAQNEVRAAEADLVRARLSVAYLLGVEREAATLRAADRWPVVEDLRLAESDDSLVERRPDVRAARQRVEAAARARDLARALATRDVTVGAGIDHYPNSETNTLGAGTSVGVSVTFPLFVRYAYEGEIARAESDLLTAQDLAERIGAQARAELAAARSDLDAAAARLRRFEQSLLSEARRSVDYAEFAYRNGALGVIDLLDARRTFRAVSLDAAAARADYAKAWSRWRAGTADPLAALQPRRP